MTPREDIVCCQTCGLVQQVEAPQPHQAAWSRPLSVAALILYVPANIYPILSMERYGVYSESTVWGSVTGLMASR